MARFSYKTDVPMGAMVSEAINDLQNGVAKVTRAAEAITMMDEDQMMAEVGVTAEEQAGFRSALNQLKNALAEDPFAKLLPNLDQG